MNWFLISRLKDRFLPRSPPNSFKHFALTPSGLFITRHFLGVFSANFVLVFQKLHCRHAICSSLGHGGFGGRRL